jgi:hypothetical protein
MRLESDMLVAVLLRLMEMGITALPLHDSVIVARKHGLVAAGVMEEVARQYAGVSIPVRIDAQFHALTQDLAASKKVQRSSSLSLCI